MPIKDLRNMRFHSLVALEITGEDAQKRKIWKCRCDCGKEKNIRARHLLSGQTVTCGCRIGLSLPKPALGLKREKHPKWKGGQFIQEDGYIMQYIGDGKYALQHKIIYQKNFGKIPHGYVVHHVNEIKTDNRIENLQLMSRKDHAVHHGLGERGNRFGACHEHQ
jgi:hypothetical protein